MSQVIRLGSNLILTRLLAPELYGVLAIGYVVMTGLGMFSDIGLNAGAMRNKRGDTPLYLNVGWVVQIGRGLIIITLALCGALLLSQLALAGIFPKNSVYADPAVPVLIAALTMQALFEGLNSTKVWTARRNMAIELITKIEVGTQLVTTIVMIVWAWLSPSLWVLAGGGIFGAALKTALTHLLLPGERNRFQWDRATFLEIFHFGKWVFVSSAISFLLSSGDRLMLGGVLDSKSMGYYAVAFTLVNALQMAVLRVVGSAVLPALSEVYRERPDQLRATYYRIRRPLDMVCLVAAGALLVLGKPIVGLMYDARYADAGWMLSLLSFTLVATRFTVFDQCLIVTGRVPMLSVLNGLRMLMLYAMVPLGYLVQGAWGAVAGVAASAVCNGVIVIVMQARYGLLDARREWMALPPYAAGAAVAWLLLRAATYFH